MDRFERIRSVERPPKPSEREVAERRFGSAIHFGRYRAFPDTRRLLIDDHPVEIGGRAFDFLVTVALAGGEIVTKDEVLSGSDLKKAAIQM
jgi:DNA-binding response OmpR family regulator